MKIQNLHNTDIYIDIFFFLLSDDINKEQNKK